MKDLCFLRYKKLAQVGNVSIVRQEVTYLLVQSPSDMTYTLDVRIGVTRADGSVVSYSSPYFEVQGPHMVKAALPTQLLTQNRTDPITTIDVFVDVPESSESDDLEFALTHDMRSGLAKLTQTFVKLLFTKPGSDKFDMDSGGGLRQAIQGVSLDQPSMVAGVVTGAIQRTTQQIISNQNSLNLPAEEMLVSAKAIEITTDKTSLSVTISLLILSRGGAAQVTFSSTTSDPTLGGGNT